MKFRKASLSQEGNLTPTIWVVHSLQKGHKVGPRWPTNSLQAISLHQAVLILSQIGELLQIQMLSKAGPRWPTNSLQAISLYQAVLTVCKICE